MSSTIESCRLISLPKISLPQGNITPVQGTKDIPFEIERVFYLYDVPGGAERGGHAHKQLQQIMIAVMGAFNVVVDDGRNRTTFLLNRAYQGVYIPPMIWSEVSAFSSGGVCLVLASLHYDEGDYIRDYNDFLATRRRAHQVP